MNEILAGVDLGGTKILTAVADEKGSIMGSCRRDTEVERGEERIVENICLSLEAALEEAEIKKDELSAMGVGSPGPLDTRKGIIHETPNLPFVDFPLVDKLEEKLGLPVYLENDANAAALGEKNFGAGRDGGDQIYITVSTGIGGGIIINDEIFHGAGDGAGEIGHMIVKQGGPTCGLGQHRGCLEAMASGTAVAREARRMTLNGRTPELEKLLAENEIDPEDQEIPGHIIAEAARRGDEAVRMIYREMGYYLGMGVASLITLFNPDMIIFGGGVMKARDLFWKEMTKSAADHALPSAREICDLVEAELGDRTGVYGAIAAAKTARA